MSFPHSKGRGGGLILIYKSKLSGYVCVEKYCCDTIFWLKVSLITSADVYLCFVYIPHENNIYYDRYNIYVFDNLLMNVAKYVEQGMVVLSGDLYSCVGECNDFIVNDDLSDTVFNNIANIVAYSNDFALPNRNSEDKSCNNFGRKLLDLCKASGLRMCNGRAGIRVVGLLFLITLGRALLITS